jgi:hypothetical protein
LRTEPALPLSANHFFHGRKAGYGPQGLSGIIHVDHALVDERLGDSFAIRWKQMPMQLTNFAYVGPSSAR